MTAFYWTGRGNLGTSGQPGCESDGGGPKRTIVEGNSGAMGEQA